MGFEIEKRFTVKAPPGAVWDFLTDPHRVATCLPGAAITGRVDDRTYTGTMAVKVGPVSSSFKGKVHFEELDAGQQRAVIVATGQDVRGKGGADMRMRSRVANAPGGAAVTVVAELNVTGIMAQFGRGMIQDVSDQMFEQFTGAMRAELEGGGGGGRAAPAPQPAAVDVVALGSKAAGRAAVRIVRRPWFWVALALVLALVIYWLT